MESMYLILLAAVVVVLGTAVASYRYVAHTRPEVTSSVTEPRWVRWVLIGIALFFMLVFLLLPLLAVFVEALRKGWDTYLTALREPDAWSAIKLTLMTAAIVLGASGWQTFWYVTLPNIKWGLLYGVILCNARARGEFGAVSVVSGHIRGQTNTMPLHVEILYNEYQSVAAFAVASLLALLALVTLVIKSVAEWRAEHERKALAQLPPERPTAPSAGPV